MCKKIKNFSAVCLRTAISVVKMHCETNGKVVEQLWENFSRNNGKAEFLQ